MYTRIVENTLRSLRSAPEILILYGPRRVGKNTLLKKLHDERVVENEHTAMYSLDDQTAQAIFGDRLKLAASHAILNGSGQGRFLS